MSASAENTETKSLNKGSLEAEKRNHSVNTNLTTESGAAVSPAEPSANPDLVWWDGDADAANPLNWPAWRKFVQGLLISFLAFLTPLASSFFAPGVPQLMEEFGSHETVLAEFVVSVYVLGFAFGPLIMAPMSEIYGRSVVYHVCNVGFTIFVIACAVAPSLNALIVFRFFCGVFGSCPLANANGSIFDMVSQKRRAKALVGHTTVDWFKIII